MRTTSQRIRRHEHFQMVPAEYGKRVRIGAPLQESDESTLFSAHRGATVLQNSVIVRHPYQGLLPYLEFL